ncbi:WD40 repeat-like protein [Exidia glandulosa HHB12029]|uniref:Peroxin-7 n=1 Tax=Exidia glandulosa HHB12029 TaxID=1314781 RepID=A0A165Q854_EXIGL|nr:WD40 repeat-like protein [Exidia glandulosa HHB12029]
MQAALPPPQLQVARTPSWAHYSIKPSPFFDHALAVASSANYGIIGNGRLHLLHTRPQLHVDKIFETQDGLYDVAWSELHEFQLASASGDGSVKLWDTNLKDLPIRAWHEHTRETMSLDWSNLEKDRFLSSSWDGSIRVWTPDRPHSLTALPAHAACVYQASWSPHTPALLASVSADGTLKLFDLRSPFSALPSTPAPPTPKNSASWAPPPVPLAPPTMSVVAHAGEVLTLDWNKYRPMVLATGGVDRAIKVWDARNMSRPAEEGAPLLGHEYAVRRVAWSPHRADLLASASYDMTARVWQTGPNGGVLRMIHDQHTEFVAGCAWSLFEEGVLATCAWDGRVHTFRV